MNHAGHDSFRMPPGLIALALGAKYAMLVIYGITAAIVEVPSFIIVGGSGFAVGWAITVGTFAAIAALGVIHTWRTNRCRLERWTTAALILAFTAYSTVLIIRGQIVGDSDGTPLAILPIALVILPTIRYYWLTGSPS